MTFSLLQTLFCLQFQIVLDLMGVPNRYDPTPHTCSRHRCVVRLTVELLSHQPGDTWTSGCNQCECDSTSMTTQCQPLPCPTVPRPACSEPGQQLVNTTNGCCTHQSCGQYSRTDADVLTVETVSNLYHFVGEHVVDVRLMGTKQATSWIQYNQN